ncbi:tyrosine-type recombinase/integrase [Sphingomonas qilianensis]|uniref:Site-specific integrase n=1 Tax=Sphingomonas qilianensis TaxID=1736690 RepID=A0ABU9XWD8_9SPHN
MPTGKITKSSVDALAADGTKQFLWDDELKGFGLQVTPAGGKSYVYQYRTGGREAQKKRYTIGRHGSPWTPALARSECKRLAALVGQGIDPTDTDRERRRQAVDLAFVPFIDTFRDGYLMSEWKDWEKAEALLRREPATVLKRKPLPTITRADLVAVFDLLKDRPATARQAHSVLRKLFRWAEGRGEIEQGKSPLGADFPAPKVVAARNRVLSDGELALAWSAACAMPYPFGPLYRFLMATGQRREECAALGWAELDRKQMMWTLPSERAKNEQAHIVPLNQLAAQALDDVARIGQDDNEATDWPDAGYVFTTTGKTPVSGHSKAKKALDAAIAALVAKEPAVKEKKPRIVPPWRVHDIRRTVATGLQRLGVRFEVTEAVLNHVSGARSGVAGVYQRHDWKNEKRAALDAWGRHIEQIGKPQAPNVVAIKAAKT